VDNGAEGIIIPCLKNKDDFMKAVELCKFPPLGNRGYIKGRGSGFGNDGSHTRLNGVSLFGTKTAIFKIKTQGTSLRTHIKSYI